MLMIDSNVIIDFWRHPTQQLKQVFIRHECCICGVQMAELLYGAVSDKDSSAIVQALSGFTMINIEESDWILLGNFLYKLRKKGISVPFPDALIACVSVKHNIPVWTHDKHFQYIQSVINDLQLYQEES